jgi:hypothetical protein
MIDFVNLKIKSTQFFGGAYRDRVCTCVHMVEYLYVYEYLRSYFVSKKTEPLLTINVQER